MKIKKGCRMLLILGIVLQMSFILGTNVSAAAKTEPSGSGRTDICETKGKKTTYKDFLRRTSVTAGGEKVKLKGCLYAYEDFNLDGAKELIIRPKNSYGLHFSKTYIFKKKKQDFRCIGILPTGGTREFAGYSPKTGLPYIFVANYSYDDMEIVFYNLKNGKARKKCTLHIDRDGKYYFNDKQVSQSKFEEKYNKYLDGPMPQQREEWKGYHGFDFKKRSTVM